MPHAFQGQKRFSYLRMSTIDVLEDWFFCICPIVFLNPFCDNPRIVYDLFIPCHLNFMKKHVHYESPFEGDWVKIS